MANHSEADRRLRGSLVWARKQKEWSQRVLAERAGVSVDTVQRLEAGRSSATLAVVERLVKALRLPLAMLLGDRGGERPISGWAVLGAPERALVVALVAYFVALGRTEHAGAS